MAGNFKGNMKRQFGIFNELRNGHGFRNQNEEVRSVQEFYNENKVVICNTYFRKSSGQLLTYQSENHASHIFSQDKGMLDCRMKNVHPPPKKNQYRLETSDIILQARRLLRNSQIWRRGIWNLKKPTFWDILYENFDEREVELQSATDQTWEWSWFLSLWIKKFSRFIISAFRKIFI